MSAFSLSHRRLGGWWVASESRLERATPFPRLEKETWTEGSREALCSLAEQAGWELGTGVSSWPRGTPWRQAGRALTSAWWGGKFSPASK